VALVTILSFETSIEANLVKAKLQSENIECYLLNENFANLMPLFNVATGGVELQVDSTNAEAAHELLKEMRTAPITNDRDEKLECPRCHSSNIDNSYRSAKNVPGIFATFFSLLWAIYPIYSKPTYVCRSCKNEFSYS
jgi:hypothetical protein